MSIKEKVTKIAENVVAIKNQKDIDFDVGVEVGRAQRDYEWWKKYCPATRRNFLYAFAGSGWTDATYGTIPNDTVIIPTQNAQFMYQYSLITDTKVTIDISAGGTNVGSIFTNASSLVTVHKLIVGPDTKMSNHFTSCSKLKHLTIEGTIAKNAYFQWCPLTKNSILNVFAALSGTATGVTAQFKTSAVNAAFETSEGANDGSASAEWTALVASKQNWTIALA